MSAQVAPDRRFTRFHACPICTGHGSLPRGHSERCAGFEDEDDNGRRYAVCTREEHAGALPPIQTAAGDSFKHWLEGSCGCGKEHGQAVARAPRPRQERQQKPQTGPLPSNIDGMSLVATYSYRRADCSLAYRVARYEEPYTAKSEKPQKTFRQFRSLEDGAWIPSIQGVERLLFRLPELLAAPPTRPVFIVEGEKKALAVAALGLVVTTCSEGAGKWKQVPARHEALRGRRVVILPDNDEPGHQHARQVADDLREVAESVRIVELPDLPDAGDVVEWLAAGGDALHLLELVIATPVYAAALPETLNSNPAIQDDYPESGIREWKSTTFRRQVMANEHLTQPLKPAAMAWRDELDVHGRSDDQPIDTYLARVARRYGVSTQTASTHARKLAKMGLLTYHPVKYRDENGMPRTRIQVGRGPLMESPQEIKPEEPASPWGGAGRGQGRHCKACKSTNVILRRQIVCRDCGSVEALADKELNVEPGEGEETADETLDMSQSQDSCPAVQDDSALPLSLVHDDLELWGEVDSRGTGGAA